MRLMTRKRLREYIDQPRHAAAREPILAWASILEHSTWRTLVDVKETFPSTDHLSGEKVCFDIGATNGESSPMSPSNQRSCSFCGSAPTRNTTSCEWKVGAHDMGNIIRLITNETELDAAQAEMARLLDIERTADQDCRLRALAVLIRWYEDEHWALPMPDPILAIRYRMEELGLQQSDMMEEFGDKTTASLILNRKRLLTLPIIRRLSTRLGLPLAVLVQEYSLTNGEVEPDDKRLSARG